MFTILGGHLGTPVIDPASVVGRVAALREAGEACGAAERVGRDGGGRSELPQNIFASSVEDPHPAEGDLVAAVLDLPAENDLFSRAPPGSRRTAPVGELLAKEARGMDIAGLIKPHLKEAADNIMAYAVAFIDQRLGGLPTTSAHFGPTCLRLL
jgi:hypothetical protein